MKALVTGASGFVGSHLVDALQEQQPCAALVRKASSVERLQALGVELRYGDLEDASSLEAALADIDCVYHCAAKVDIWGGNDEYVQANLVGTKNLLQAAYNAKVKRFIHVSSASVHGPDIPQNANENCPYTDVDVPYIRTKIAAEKLAIDFFQRGLAVTIIRPVNIYGPRGRWLTEPIALLDKGLPLLFNLEGRTYPLVYVGNLVDAMLLAARKDEAVGQAYLITDDETVTWNDYIRKLAEFRGKKLLPLELPFPLVYQLSFMNEIWSSFIGAKNPLMLNRFSVTMVAMKSSYDISKIKRELGYEPRIKFNEGMEICRQWLAYSNNLNI